MAKKMGRPPKHETHNDLEEKIELYFEQLKSNDPKVQDRPPTTAGLAHFLGFSDRQSLYDQKDRGEQFSCVIKRAILAIEAYHEESLNRQSCTGSIFWLKNHKWKDGQSLEHSGPDGGPITQIINTSNLTDQEKDLFAKIAIENMENGK